jgi:hypothetical protein
MACFTCIGCGAETTGTFKPDDWHTITVQVDNVGSRTTAKLQVLSFCNPCKPIAQRFASAMCAREEAVPDLVETFDERPAFFGSAVPAMAR